MSGASIVALRRSCAIAYNSTDDPNPAHFAGDEFLDAAWAFAGNDTVVSLVHTEYPGNVYHNCSGPAYPHCWTVTLGLAVSHDRGLSWQHARPPPAHLVAAVPYGYNQSQLASGWGDPSNMVQGPDGDGYWYVAMWNRNQVGLQPPGICIMRSNSLLDPAAWRGWGGRAFDVPFASPYTLPPGQEARHVCTPVNLPAPQCAAMGLTRAEKYGVYIVTMDCQTDSFMYATSRDLVHWSDAAPFYAAKDLPPGVQREVTRMTYPTLMDPAAPARGDNNFATVGGDTAQLFWVSIGHSPHTDGRHLWATSFQIGAAAGAAAAEGEMGRA